MEDDYCAGSLSARSDFGSQFGRKSDPWIYRRQTREFRNFSQLLRPQTDHLRSNRRLDNSLNIFEGILKNWYLIGINLLTITGQLLVIFFGGSALSAVRLDGTQWAISLGLGALSLVVGVVIRLIPDASIRSLLSGRGQRAPVALPPDDTRLLQPQSRWVINAGQVGDFGSLVVRSGVGG